MFCLCWDQQWVCYESVPPTQVGWNGVCPCCWGCVAALSFAQYVNRNGMQARALPVRAAHMLLANECLIVHAQYGLQDVLRSNCKAGVLQRSAAQLWSFCTQVGLLSGRDMQLHRL